MIPFLFFFCKDCHRVETPCITISSDNLIFFIYPLYLLHRSLSRTPFQLSNTLFDFTCAVMYVNRISKRRCLNLVKDLMLILAMLLVLPLMLILIQPMHSSKTSHTNKSNSLPSPQIYPNSFSSS